MTQCDNHVVKILSNETEAILFLNLCSKDVEQFKSLMMAYCRVMKMVKKWPTDEHLPTDGYIQTFDDDVSLLSDFIIAEHSCYCGKLEESMESIEGILKKKLQQIAEVCS